MMVTLSLLLCGAAFLYQSGFSLPANHSTSQPDSNQTHISQLQQTQESLNQSDETLLQTNQTGLNNHGLNHSDNVQTETHQSEDIVLQNGHSGLNQSLNQSDQVQTQQDQSEYTILQNSQSGLNQSLNQSSGKVQTQQPHQWLNQSHQSLNQSDQVQTQQPPQWLNQTHQSLNQSDQVQTQQPHQWLNQSHQSLNQSDQVQTQQPHQWLNQSHQSLNQSDQVQTQQPHQWLNQSHQSLNQSDQVQTQQPHQWLNQSHQTLNQSDQVQTQPFQWSNQSHHAHKTQHNQSQHGSFSVRKPTSEQDLHWLADCRTLQPVVDLSFHGLSHLPAILFNSDCVSRIRYLDLTGNQLSTLDPDLLTLLTSLSVLKVSHNRLTVFPGKALRNLIYLRTLDFSHNRLQSLPAYSLPTGLVNLNISFNRLTQLSEGVFPSGLVNLDISFNNLTQLSEGVFHGLHNLQTMNVSHNQLQDIHPRAFEVRMPKVVLANFSYNKLTAFDGWPYIFNQRITADFRHNSISHFTNHMNLTVLTESFGNVDLRYNNLTRFPSTFLDIYLNGIPITPMMIAMYFNLNIQHNPFICDCQLHWIVKLATGNLVSYADGFANYLTCGAPPFLRGRNLDFLFRHKYLLVCEVQEGCPQGCRCMDTPHHGHVLVSCDANLHNYTALPAELPAQGLVFLNLSGHSLRRLEAGPCDVSRLKVLDVNHNQVSYVSPSMLKRAVHLEELNLRHNQLTSLPSGLQRLPVDKLRVAGNPLLCSCALASFGTWVKTVAQNPSQKVAPSNHSDVYSVWQGADIGTDLLDFLSSEDNSSMRSLAALLTNNQSVGTYVTPDLLTANCSLPDDRRCRMALVDPSDWGLDCDSLHIYVHALVWSGVMLLLLVVGMVVGWRWRYTLRVFYNYVHFRAPVLSGPAEYETDDNSGGTGTPEMTSPETYHVYLSVDEQNDVITTWVKQSLLPMLETKGRNSLLVYLPLRQEPLGVCMQENRADVISNSLKFLVVLSHGYSDNGQCRQELDFACFHHQQFCHKNIVIVLKDDLPGPLPPTQQTVHEGSVHIDNDLHNNNTDDQVGGVDHSDKDHPHNEDTVGTTGDKGDEVPPRHINRLRNARDEANDTVHEIVVQADVENHNVYGTETVTMNEDIAEHPANTIKATAEVDREITVTDTCDTPQVKTDRTLHTDALPVGTHYPPPKRPATYIPMCPLRKDVHTERDPSTATNGSTPGRSVDNRQVPTMEIPNQDKICACALDAVDKPETEPKDITDVDDDGEFTKGADNSKEHWWARKVKRNDSKQQLLPLDESGDEFSYQNRRQHSTHSERPEERREVHGQELMNCYMQGQRRGSRQGPKRKEQRDMLERLSQFWEDGYPVAMEPLRSFLLQGRYLCVSDRFFKYKLLYQLSRK